MTFHPAPRIVPRRVRGFTLIELLTVIAIIGVLAAILIPVVGTVRQSAQSAKTASNIRQLQTANIAFANDNKGFFVGNSPFGENPYSRPWFSYLPFFAYAGIKVAGTGPGGEELPSAWDTNYPEVAKTGRTVSLSAAPRDDRNYTIAMNTTGWTHSQSGEPSSGGWSIAGAWTQGKIHQSKVRNPNKLIIFFESTHFMSGMYDRTAWTSDNGIYPSIAFRNKSNKAYVAYADGHVGTLVKADIESDNATTRRYFWWDAD